jgi:hypothetical protein
MTSVSLSSRTSSVILTSADRQIEPLFADSKLQKQLYENLYTALIFHDKVYLPDIFALISTPISREVRNSSGATDLEKAIELGFIVPFLRHGSTSFREALDLIRQQGIAGLSENCDTVASRLDQALSNGAEVKSTKNNTSISYADSLLSNLRLIEEGTDKRLELTRKFLQKTQLTSRIENITMDGQGITRTMFFKILRDYVGATGNSLFSDAGRDLYQPAQKLSDASTGIPICSLTTLGTLIYHQNLSKSYNSLAYFSGTSLRSALGAPTNNSLDPESKTLKNAIQTLTISVKLPSVSQIMTVGIKRFLEIKNQFCRGFFSELEVWELRGDNEAQLIKSLEEYCASILGSIKAEAPASKVILNRFNEADRAAIAGSLSLINKSLESTLGIPGIGQIVALLGQLSTISFNVIQERPVNIYLPRAIVT